MHLNSVYHLIWLLTLLFELCHDRVLPNSYFLKLIIYYHALDLGLSSHLNTYTVVWAVSWQNVAKLFHQAPDILIAQTPAHTKQELH
jgi:hypothetical protein